MNQTTPTTASLTRRVFVVAIVAVSITMIVASVVMNTSLGPKVVIPGPLSAPHALLQDDCTNCHSAEMDSIKGVLHGLTNSDLSLRDSQLCLDCHDLGEYAMLAHTTSPASLEQDSPRVGFAQPPRSAQGEYACAVCHVEHEGRRNDLKAMTEGQCQSCHAEQFDGFHKGHPGFEDYPYRRRLRINFDHAGHINHDFPAGDVDLAPTSCADCHSLDGSGDFMMTASFEQACASCHDNDVRATSRSGGSGVAFFGLPAIDTMTLDDAGIGIGQWPADSGIAEGEITPFVRLMLAGEPGALEDLRIIESLDLLDLQDATDEQLAAVARIAWAIKMMAQEFAHGGHDAIVRRIAASIGADSADDERVRELSSSLTGGLSRSILQESVQAWLPGLDAELRRRGSGADPITDTLEDALFEEIEATGQAWASQGGWYRDDMAFALKYRPTGHADPFLRAWAELAAGNPKPGARLLGAFADPEAVGQCFKCHSVDQTGPESLLVNWKASRPEDVLGGLTRFSHAPHLPLLGKDGCLSCHAIEPQSRRFEQAYSQYDPGVYVSAIVSMSQTECAKCHTPKKVATACLDCHDYHARRPITRLRAGAPLKPIGRPPESRGGDTDPIE